MVDQLPLCKFCKRYRAVTTHAGQCGLFDARRHHTHTCSAWCGWGDDDDYYEKVTPLEFVSDLVSIMQDGDFLAPEKLLEDVLDMLRCYLAVKRKQEAQDG